MAVRTKTEKTPLQVAQEELGDLENLLAKAEHHRTTLQQELEDVWSTRLAPNAAVDRAAVQKRSVELKALLEDEAQIMASLREKIQEHQARVQTLTKEKARTDAAAACLAVEAEFAQLVQAIDTAAMEAWLDQARAVHSVYFAANGTQNMKIERMRAGLVDLVQRAKTLQIL